MIIRGRSRLLVPFERGVELALQAMEFYVGLLYVGICVVDVCIAAHQQTRPHGLAPHPIMIQHPHQRGWAADRCDDAMTPLAFAVN